VKQQNGDEGAIQARIMEWWEEGESAPKAEEQWENVNKKKPKNKYIGGGGSGSAYNNERSVRESGRGRGGGPSGRGGRGAGGYRGRGGAPSGRGPKGVVGKPRDAPAPPLGTEETAKPEADNAPGAVLVSSPAPTAASVVQNGGRATTKEYVTTESKPARVQPEGFISSNDPTPSGRTAAAAAAAEPVVRIGGNVWATKGAAHIIQAQKPLPPPVVPPSRHTSTSKARNLPVESKNESESSAQHSEPLSPNVPLPVAPCAPLESTLEQDIGALDISAGAETSGPEDTFNTPTATVDQAETDTLLSEASSMAGLSASVNGANVNAAGWKPLLNENGNVIDLAPPAEESKNEPEEEMSYEDLPVPPRVVSPQLSSAADPQLPPQEIVTSSIVGKPGQSVVLNMGRWDVNDGDEQAIDFGFGSFGVDADDAPEETAPSNGLPAVVTDKVTTATEAVAAATLSPARPPPGLGLGGGAMPPMPAGAVLVHELEGKLEAATKAKEEAAPEVPDKAQSAAEEDKSPGPQTQPAEAPPTANVSVPSTSLPQAPGMSGPQTSAGGMYPSVGYGAAPGMTNMYSAYSGAGGFMGGVGAGGMPTLLNPQQQAQQVAAQQAAQQHSSKDDATETASTTAASTAGAAQTNPSSASSASALNSAFPPGMMAYNPAAAAAFGGGFYGQHAGYAHHGHQMAGAQGLSGNVNLPYGAYGGYPPAQFGAGAGGYASAYQQQLAAQMGVGGGVGGPPGSSQAGGVGYGVGGAYGDSAGGNQGSSGGVGEQQHLNLGGVGGSGNDSRGIGGGGGGGGGYAGNKSNYRGNRNNNSNYNQGGGGGGGGYGSHSHSQQSQYSQHNPAGLHQQHGGLGYGGGNPYGAGMGGYGSQGMDHFQAQRGYGGVGLHSHNAYGMQQQNSYGNQALGGGQGGFGQAQDSGMDSLDSRGGGHKNKGNKGPRGAGGFGNTTNMQHQFQQGSGGVGGGQPFGGLQQQGPEHGSAGGSSAGGGGNSSTGGWGQQGWGGAGATNSWQQGGGN
jgi:hypothetical protein